MTDGLHLKRTRTKCLSSSHRYSLWEVKQSIDAIKATGKSDEEENAEAVGLLKHCRFIFSDIERENTKNTA